jgi:hypothetical protein
MATIRPGKARRLASRVIWLYFIQFISSLPCQSSFPIHPLFKVKLSMTSQPPKAPPLYPKTHLLAASGIAALLSLALLVFPSSEVEAKRTTLSLELETPAEQLKQDQGSEELVQTTNDATPAPFAQIEQPDSTPEATAKVEEPKAQTIVKWSSPKAIRCLLYSKK